MRRALEKDQDVDTLVTQLSTPCLIYHPHRTDLVLQTRGLSGGAS